MIDHLTLTVRDISRSRPFYDAILAPLGCRVLMEFGDMCGFGDRKPYLWMKQGDPPTTPQHLAFVAPSRAAVDAFHAAALAAGARDNGAPGLRPDYHPSYYAAFVLDPDGHNLEAVIHRPEPSRARRSGRPAAPARKAGGARAKKGRGAAGAKARPARPQRRKARR